MPLLPRHTEAVIAESKLLYSLDPAHETGRHKARVFSSALGLDSDSTQTLRFMLTEGISVNEGDLRYTLRDGTERWVVEWLVVGRLGAMRFVSAWNVDRVTRRPTLVSCYLKEVTGR